MKMILLRVTMAVIFNLQLAYAWPDYYNPYDFSSIEIRSKEAGAITVTFDDQFYPNQTRIFSLSQVTPGNHRVEIFTDRLVYHGYYATTEHIRLYVGNFYVQPASFIKAVVDQTGRFYVKDVDPLIIQQPQPPYYPYNYPPAYGSNQSAIFPMPAADFDRLCDVIKDQWYDDTRLDVAMQALSANYFNSQQVAEIMKIFWYENSRLAFAKAAYPRVVDKQNYYIVNKEFWYSSSVSELTQYLSGH